MNGVEFLRRKQRRTRCSLVKLTGITDATIKKMEEETTFDRPCHFYMRIANALGVTIDELIRDYPESMLEAGDHYVRESKSAHPNNCLAGYKVSNHLNNDQMAVLLGLGGRESARKACEREEPLQIYVERLAQLEGITVKQFVRRYGAWGHDEGAA